VLDARRRRRKIANDDSPPGCHRALFDSTDSRTEETNQTKQPRKWRRKHIMKTKTTKHQTAPSQSNARVKLRPLKLNKETIQNLSDSAAEVVKGGVRGVSVAAPNEVC